jgi:hypothetical protein
MGGGDGVLLSVEIITLSPVLTNWKQNENKLSTSDAQPRTIRARCTRADGVK